MPIRDAGEPVEAVIFDLGGVLIDWDPRHLYRGLLDEATMEWFLGAVCTSAWNSELDRGVAFKDAIEELCSRHPEQAELIEAYWHRWDEMVAGPIDGTVRLLDQLRQRVPVFALSNWSAETFPRVAERFSFLGWFTDTLLSSEVGLVKPEVEIFEEAIRRFSVSPARTLFIDDRDVNVTAARQAGFRAVRFESPRQLGGLLRGCAVLPGDTGG